MKFTDVCCEPYFACRQGEKEFLAWEGAKIMSGGGEKNTEM